MQQQQNFTLSYLANTSESTLQGDAHCEIRRIAPLRDAKPGDISFFNNARHIADLRQTQASAVILKQEYLADCSTNALIHDNPLLCYTKLVPLFISSQTPNPGIDNTALIGKGCRIHESVFIGPHCVIGDNVLIGEGTIIRAGCVIGNHVTIEANCILWPRIVIYDGIRIGQRVIIHSGAVIGADGFGNVQHEQTWVKVPQIGGVIIHDDVEIGANTTIDRGTIEDTIIGKGVKLDNQIQIAHNVEVGDHTAIAACTGIAGSARIGKHCMIGGAVNIVGHITIADHTLIAGASNVGRNIEDPGFYLSAFDMQPHMKWKKSLVRFYQLDDLAKRLFKLEKHVCEK